MNTDLKQTWTATKRTAYQAQETWNQNGVFLARKYTLTQAEVATVRLTLPKKKTGKIRTSDRGLEFALSWRLSEMPGICYFGGAK